MADGEVTLIGRSSSHFTRTTRIFAHELAVPHAFRPVLDLTTVDLGTYGDNPALKVPVLLDDAGPLFGTENICRSLAERAGRRDEVVLRGDVSTRVVANAEELILSGMSAEVTIVTMTMAGQEQAISPKVRRSIENSLEFLEANLDRVLAALPARRALSFCETTLFCMVRHLPFRKVMNVDGYPKLLAFAAAFEERESARATAYRFDTA
jgi:glutathione S-transferase